MLTLLTDGCYVALLPTSEREAFAVSFISNDVTYSCNITRLQVLRWYFQFGIYVTIASDDTVQGSFTKWFRHSHPTISGIFVSL